MKRVLVTGGAGFIGSHLIGTLLAEGHHVICVDNFITGFESNLACYSEHPRFELLRADIMQPLFMEVQEIYNLACPASPVHALSRPVATAHTNSLGVINMLELANQTQAKLLQASTSEIYGDPEQHPQSETYWGHTNLLGIRSCYNEGKRFAESLCMAYQRQYGMTVKIGRIFNTYGPHMHVNDGRVISRFVTHALRNQPLVVYGDGQQTRSFCYIDDLVRGLVTLMACPEAIGPVNLGNPAEMTILDLAHLIIDRTGSHSKIVHEPLPPDDPVRRKPDITLAKTALGWEPQYDLEVGLAQTIVYYEQQLVAGSRR